MSWLNYSVTITAEEKQQILVPESFSKAQVTAALINPSLWSSIVAFVEAIEDTTGKVLVEMVLNDTDTYQQNSQFLQFLSAAAIDLTEPPFHDLSICNNFKILTIQTRFGEFFYYRELLNDTWIIR